MPSLALPSPSHPMAKTGYEVTRVRVIRELLALGLTLEDLRRRSHRLATLDAEIARLTYLRQSLAAAAGAPWGAPGSPTPPSGSVPVPELEC